MNPPFHQSDRRIPSGSSVGGSPNHVQPPNQYSSFWRMHGAPSSPTSTASPGGETKDGDDSSHPRKKRVHYSCEECHRRKQKCNRQCPCQHCLARGIPQRCKFTANVPASSGHGNGNASSESNANAGPSSSADVSELKQIMQDGFADILSRLGAEDQIAAANKQRKIQEEDEDDLVIVSSATAATSRGSKLLDMMQVNNAAAVMDPTLSLDSHTSIDHALYELSLRDPRGNGPLSKSLLACLPPKHEVQVLFDSYIEDVSNLRYPISLDTIKRSMERLPQMQQRGYITTDEIDSFSVIAAMLSQAVLRTERFDVIPNDIKTVYMGARKLVFACMKSLCISDILGRNSFEKCVALHLSARFLLMDRRMNEAWTNANNAVRCAQSIGLHRYDPTGKPIREAEEIRLMWCILRYDERSFSMMMERPTSIDDDVCSTTPPPASGNITVDDAIFIQRRFDLATFQGRILSLIHNKNGVRMRDTLALDKEIIAFRQSLPTDLRGHRKGYIQRFMMHSHTLQARMALLRPFFLRCVPRNASALTRQRQIAIRLACAEAACEDLTLREELVEEVQTVYGGEKVPGLARNHIRTPRWFTSLVILGCYMLTFNAHTHDGQISGATAESESNAERALAILPQARQHLKIFIDLAEKKQSAETTRDAALDREVSVVRMFLEKGSETTSERVNHASANDSSNLTTSRKRARTSGSTSAPSNTGHELSHSAPHSMQATPPSHHTPSSSEVGSHSGANGLQGEDLQAIFDAWFQSGINHANTGQELTQMFDIPSTEAMPPLTTFEAAMSLPNNQFPFNSTPTSKSDPATAAAAVQLASMQQIPQPPVTAGMTSQPSLYPSPPSFAASTPHSTRAAGEGEFWQGFINMLSTQSGKV
ncbi:uncharacterized protein FA14DRAFT_188677 [Meira miltonrushii]|uniref:Zn(2)-C6 fungal-type domain-containing protein n=1 Tax=Meira miltonrushii TaxID=1280837 RepID=A0A316VAP5_9BASI|nr:uncharacterized protein FA14DRAFT_188677 [Meira miltonrushii]PWN34596.1 hypothetical protein FA14DRAFT_188677 [Meira miltonrushii]